MNINTKKLIKNILNWIVIVSIIVIAICLLIKIYENLPTLIKMYKDLSKLIKTVFSAIIITGGASLLVSAVNHIWTRIRDKNLKKKEEVTGMFGFIIEDNLACVALKNIGKNEVDFDFKKGVCLQWENKNYYIINVIDNNMGSSIPPKAIRQFNCSVRPYNDPEKNRINSPLLKVFIYTTRGNGFYLSPTPSQLKRWQNITTPQWEETVKTIEDIPGIQTIQ